MNDLSVVLVPADGWKVKATHHALVEKNDDDIGEALAHDIIFFGA